MKTVTICVSTLEEQKRRMAAAFEGVAQEPRIALASYELMHKVLTPKRLELLQAMLGQVPLGLRELTRRIKRDVSNVHDDIEALTRAGVFDRTDEGVVFPYDQRLSRRRSARRQAPVWPVPRTVRRLLPAPPRAAISAASRSSRTYARSVSARWVRSRCVARSGCTGASVALNGGALKAPQTSRRDQRRRRTTPASPRSSDHAAHTAPAVRYIWSRSCQAGASRSRRLRPIPAIHAAPCT